MSVYKQEATREEMVREALSRMEALELDGKVIEAFRKEGRLYLSQDLEGQEQTELRALDEALAAKVRDFEEEYGCLVYHVQRCCVAMLECEVTSLLFVSPASSDWREEQLTFQSCGAVLVYLESPLESGIGEIMVDPRDGGVTRIG